MFTLFNFCMCLIIVFNGFIQSPFGNPLHSLHREERKAPADANCLCEKRSVPRRETAFARSGPTHTACAGHECLDKVGSGLTVQALGRTPSPYFTCTRRAVGWHVPTGTYFATNVAPSALCRLVAGSGQVRACNSLS